MSIDQPHFLSIEKEKIADLRFPEKEVLESTDAIKQRTKDIERAMLLGNNYKGKVKIFFEDIEKLLEVETTIWGFTDKRVLLKKDLVIPIHRIHSIKF